RTAKQALGMLVLVKETLGDDWLTPERFRIGASSLLNDLLMQLGRLERGAYPSPDAYSPA
ncbi:MAG: deoxyribose-phosphate aldolase, partial [Dermatophilaceae bacterium]